jgi:hypothetical protein
MAAAQVAVREQLEMQIGEILAQPVPSPTARTAPPADEPRPETPAPPETATRQAVDDREPFGRWLIAQRGRGDWVDTLADAARKDPRFPKNGSPDDVRKHLNAMQAEGDMFEAVDDAELDWLSL